MNRAYSTKFTTMLVRYFSTLLFLIALTSPELRAQPNDGSEAGALLNPDNATLVLVDYLTGFRPGIKTVDWDDYKERVIALMKTGKAFDLPTIVLGDEGGYRGEFFAALDEYYPDAPRIGRNTPSAWQVPAFREQVRAYGNRKLILAGISIDNCVLLTTLEALRDGYEVYVVTDVSGTTTELVEDTSLLRLRAAGAILTTWVSLGSELLVGAGGWATPQGKALGQIYQDHSAWGGN